MLASFRSPNFYSGGLLDRGDGVRDDPAWVGARLADPDSRLLLFEDGMPLMRSDGADMRPVWLPAKVAEAACFQGEPAVLLGVRAGQALFAAALPVGEEGNLSALGVSLHDAAFVSLRIASTRLPADEANLCVHAKGLLWWHQRHRFCGACGCPTAFASAGYRRRCTGADCGMEHFPRTDPAVIMLVTHEDHALLGRSPRFAEAVYSALAGFVEPGESLEDAVAREVFEEVGVRLLDIRYHSSQPWPFPGSIMLGFSAAAAARTLCVNRAELEQALWITRPALQAAIDAGEIALPRPDSIARRLIEDWLAGEI